MTAGKNAVFTVEAQEGYVIKNVSCESAEISAVRYRYSICFQCTEEKMQERMMVRSSRLTRSKT